jgi:hypothetical protein
VAKSENPSPTAGLHTILGQFLDETPTFPYANPYGHTIVEAGSIPPQADINSLRRADCHSLISACNYLIFKKNIIILNRVESPFRIQAGLL